MTCATSRCAYPRRSEQPIDLPYVESPKEKAIKQNPVCFGPRSKATKVYGTYPNEPGAVYGTMPSKYCDMTDQDLKKGCTVPIPDGVSCAPKPKNLKQEDPEELYRYAAKSYSNYDFGCPNCRLGSCGCRQYLTGEPYTTYYENSRKTPEENAKIVKSATVGKWPTPAGQCDRDQLSFTIMPSIRSAPLW